VDQLLGRQVVKGRRKRMPMMDDDDVGLTSSYGELAHERLVYACMVHGVFLRSGQNHL
jgi:hypothetical protein